MHPYLIIDKVVVFISASFGGDNFLNIHKSYATIQRMSKQRPNNHPSTQTCELWVWNNGDFVLSSGQMLKKTMETLYASLPASKPARQISFFSVEEVMVYLQQRKGREVELAGEVYVYVDGSYGETSKKAAWSWVAIRENKVIDNAKGLTSHDALSRNIDGELEAAKQALLWAEKQKKAVVLVYDYEGIARWVDGSWKAKSVVAKKYLEEVLPHAYRHRFQKARSHSGNRWNDYADRLARSVFDETN